MIHSDPPRGTLRLFLEHDSGPCEVEVVVTVRSKGAVSVDKSTLLYAARAVIALAARELDSEEPE